jgi:general secretion pathway protein J
MDRDAGFTLIELLVSLAIFALLSIMAYGGLNLVLDARERTEARLEQLSELQMSYSLMSRDFEQVVNRPVRDEFGDRTRAMIGDRGEIEFTRAGWRNPAGLQRRELQRVAWRLDDERLIRMTWPVLDRTQATEAAETIVLNEILEFELRFLMPDGEWRDFWPPPGDGELQTAILPRAIEVTLETEHWGSIRRLFRTPDAIGAMPGVPTP